MAGFRYRLYLENGEGIGKFTTAAPVGSIGDAFYDGSHTRFRITNIVNGFDLGSGEYAGMFVVTPVEFPRWGKTG